jgi:hypothetical protein
MVTVVGWVGVRNPTTTRVTLGFARLNPTYENRSLAAALSVNELEDLWQAAALPATTLVMTWTSWGEIHGGKSHGGKSIFRDF